MKPPPAKKLRIIHKSKTPEVTLELKSLTSPHQVIQAVLSFEHCLPTSSVNAEKIIGTLLEQFQKESETYVRAKLVSLIAVLVKTPGFSPNFLINELFSFLHEESSHVVTSQLLNTLLATGKLLSSDVKLHKRLLQAAEKVIMYE